jgi:multidrug efflux pump subunit AcrA (membrane-fusion protein)
MLIHILFCVLAGCTRSGTETDSVKIVKPVAVMELKEGSYPVMLHYTGTVESKEVKRYAFKTAGRIAEVFVKEGQSVKKGDKLVLLEQQDLKFTVDAAKTQMEAAKAQYEKAVNGAREEEIRLAELNVHKAQSSYNFLQDQYKKIKELYQNGAVSQQSLEECQLQMEQAKYSLEQAEKTLELAKNGARREEIEALLKQVETAKANFEANEKLMQDALITADSDGYVLSVISKENEIAAAGSPVVVVGNSEYIGKVGLIEEDVSKVMIGDEVKVDIGGKQMKGKITTIHKVPDDANRTYTAEISFDNTAGVNIGAVIKVVMNAGRQTGIWVPIQYILNDGEDYVYVIENSRAKRKNVKLNGMIEEKVCAQGLSEGDMLITEGIKSIKDGYEVSANGSDVNSIGQ